MAETLKELENQEALLAIHTSIIDEFLGLMLSTSFLITCVPTDGSYEATFDRRTTVLILSEVICEMELP